MALSIDASDKQQGTGSLVNAISSTAVINEQWYFNYGANTNWGGVNSGNLRVGMWLKSSVATSSGDLSWQDGSSTNLTAPLDTVAIPGVLANIWTYESVNLGSATRTAIRSYGVRHTTQIGADTVKLDSISAIFDSADVITNWSGDSNIAVSFLNTAGNFKEGAGAIRCVYAAAAGTGTNGDCFRSAGGGSNFTMGPGTIVSFWVRSSVALNAGDFAWTDDGSASVGSPEDVVNLSALPANTWTYITLTAANSNNKILRSYGLRQLIDKGAMTIDIDAMGKEIDACDAISNWTAPSANTLVLSVNVATKHEGAGSLQNIISSYAVNGDYWYENLGSSANWSGYATVGFWVNSTVATSTGDIQFQYSGSSDLASPIASINLGALSANIWTYQKLTLTGTRASISSYGFKYNANTSARTVFVDDVLLGPGRPTFSGQTIDVRTLALTSPQTITVIYGNGGGTSGATATNAVGNSVFTTQSRISDSGTLINVAVSPVVLVTDSASVFVLNNPGAITAGARAAYTVTRKDAFGNPVTIGTTIVNLSSSSTGVNKKFYDAASGGNIITSVTVPNGSSTANFWYYDELAGTWTITAFQTGFTSGVNTQIVNLAAEAVLFLNHPGTVPANTRAAYVVTRKDAFGNLTTSGSLVISLISDSTGVNHFYDAASGGNIITSVTIANTNSSANFWYLDDKPGVWTITVSSGTLTSAMDSLTVTVSAAKFVIVNPGPGTVGIPLVVTVRAEDNYGNVDVGYGVGVTLATTGSATGGGLVNITNGVGAKTITDNVAETTALSLTDSQSTGLNVSSTQNVAFSPAAAAQFFLNHPDSISAGARAAYTVTRKDLFGNLATSGSQTVYLYSSSTILNKKFYDASTGGNIITSISITNGNSSANFWYYDELAGTWTITASDNSSAPDGATGIIDATDSLTVSAVPTSAAKFVILPPGNDTVGNPVTITIQAEKADNSIDSNYTNNVTLVVSGSATGAGVVNVVNGIGTKNISDTVAESVNLSLTDSASTGLDISSTGVAVFNAGPATQFALSNPGNMAAGTRLGYVVFRKDQFSNPVASGSIVVYLYSSSASVNKNFYDVASGGSAIGSVAISDGSSSANLWYYDDTAGTYAVTASDSAISPDGATGIIDAVQLVAVSATVIVPAKFIIATSSNSAQTGGSITVTVMAVDNDSNLAVTYNNSVTLVASGSATGGGEVNITDGTGAKIISDAVAETVNLSLQDSALTGLNVSATVSISFTAVPPPPPPAVVQSLAAAPFRADIVFNGRAFPGAKANIIVLDDNNVASVLAQTTVTGASGDFEIRFNDVTKTGFYAFALLVTDKNGDSVQTQSYRFEVAGPLFKKSILVSPTTGLLRETVTKGDFLTVQGYASPDSRVEFQIDGGQSLSPDITADKTGFYKILFGTADLDFGSHFVRVRQISSDSRKSEYSPQKIFNVSRLFAPRTDLNNDGKVGVSDLSIFLSLWNLSDQTAKKQIDFNNDGTVDLKDFSIFVRTVSR